MVSYANIPEKDQEWLWRGRIPLGMVSMAAAKRKAGKGQVARDLAARVSRDDVMPDGTDGILGSVLMATLEDDPEVIMVRGLKAAKANRSYVFDITETPNGPFHVASDLVWLRQQIEDINGDPKLPDVRLIILDPLNQVASGHTKSDAKVRVWAMELATIARDYHLAVVLVHHTLKDGVVISGGSAIQDVPRSLLRITRDEDDPRIRTLVLDASNVASEDVEPIRYTVADDGNGAHAVWLSEPPDTASLTPSQVTMFDALQIERRPMSVSELASAAGVNTNSARVMLHKMCKAGVAESLKAGSGMYQLARHLAA